MLIEKPTVKIHREQNHYLVYFIELRRIIPVNYIGAKIIEYFFNNQKPVKTILNILKKSSYNLEEKDIENFLRNLKKTLETFYEGGYPVVEEEQMEIPLAAELQINTTCNLRCKHCCQSDYASVMPIKQVKSILDILYKAKVFEINLVGGELFLHPNIEEIIKLCCDKYRFSTNIITNGTLFTPFLVKKLSKFKSLLFFLVSLEGIGEINDYIRGKGIFRKVDKTLKILKKAGFHTEISTTINNFNINHYQELINYSESLGIPLNFNLFKPFRNKQDRLTLSPEKYFDFVRDIFKQRLSKGLNIGLTNAAITAEMFNQSRRNECRATLSGLTINVKGQMVPCPFLSEIGYYDKKKLPVFDKNFLKSWQTNRYFKEFRKGNLRECQACSYIFRNDVSKKSPYGISAFKNYIKSH